MTPHAVSGGGGGGIPAEIYSGPYGFLVVITFLFLYAVREWRQARQSDVAAAEAERDREREKRLRAEADRDSAERHSNEKVEQLDKKIDDLREEMRQLKAQHATQYNEVFSALSQARRMLAAHYPPEEIP